MRRAGRSADLFTGSMRGDTLPNLSTKQMKSGFSGRLRGHGVPEHLQERLEMAALGADVSDRDAERVPAPDEGVRDERAAVRVDPGEDPGGRRVGAPRREVRGYPSEGHDREGRGRRDLDPPLALENAAESARENEVAAGAGPQDRKRVA